MFVTVDGKSVHYTKKGEGGATVILVHGWGGTGRSLDRLADLLSRRHRVLTIDIPGFGASDKPDPSWGIKEYASLVSGFIKKVAGKPVVYFGHSFGGALGLYLAAHRGELISKLVVAGASFHRSPTGSRGISNAINRLPIPRLAKLSLRKILYKLFYPRSDILSYPMLEENYRRIVGEDLTGILTEIKIPVLILWGNSDKDTPVEDARLLHEKITGSQLVTFTDVSHNLPLKHAPEVDREMEKFI